MEFDYHDDDDDDDDDGGGVGDVTDTDDDDDDFDDQDPSKKLLAGRAFKKWKDHRPSFDEMHAEDLKRRPRSLSSSHVN